jgi:hypothetical protein
MQFAIVRSNAPECEPTCPECISAEGMIGTATPALFKRVLKILGGRKLPIIVEFHLVLCTDKDGGSRIVATNPSLGEACGGASGTGPWPAWGWVTVGGPYAPPVTKP